MRTVIVGVGALFSTLALGCSAPPEPIPKASMSFKVDYPVAAGIEGTCNRVATAGIGSDAGVPDLPIAGQESPRIASFGGEVVDGQRNSAGLGQYDIECKITGNETIKLDIAIAGPNTHPLIGTTYGEVQLELRGTIGSDGKGSGRVDVATSSTSLVYALADCSFLAMTEPQDATKFQIGPGEARLVFTCPQARSADDDFSVCETRGSISIRDCVKE